MLPALEIGDELGGKYVIEALLGRGGMGAVYRARHKRLDQRVAIKTLLLTGEDGAGLDRFEREAKIGAGLTHPFIASVYDIERRSDGSLYIVMEYLQGNSLESLVDRRALTDGDLFRWCAQICDALTYAHSRGVVHRDIKPANIFITREGTAKLIDFGISKQSVIGSVTSSAIIGTPKFMSPEQLRAFRVDGMTDVFALCVLLFRVLAGAYPFGDGEDHEYLVRVLNEPPSSLEHVRGDLSPGLVAAIMRGLERDPAERVSAGVLGRELRSESEKASNAVRADDRAEVESGVSHVESGEPTATAAARRAKRVWGTFGLVTTLLAVGLGAATFGTRSHPRESASDAAQLAHAPTVVSRPAVPKVAVEPAMIATATAAASARPAATVIALPVASTRPGVVVPPLRAPASAPTSVRDRNGNPAVL